MDLTPEIKAKIDGMSYQRMLSKWRNEPPGHPWFTRGAAATYFEKRMHDLRDEPGGHTRHVEASKLIGWAGE